MNFLDPRSLRRLALLAPLLALLPPAGAQTRTDLPEGLLAGRWVVAPYVDSQFAYSDNIFRRPDGDPNTESDEIYVLEGGVRALLPFRNSSFGLEYRGTKLDYAEQEFTRDTQHRFGAHLDMRLGSHDRFEIRENYTRGFSDVLAIDPGGEYVFNGEPFTVNRIDLELSRAVPAHRGYSVRVSRIDSIFDAHEPVPFFNYRGYETAAEFLQPIAGRRWLIAHYDARRFDNFRPAGPVGVPFRQEKSDSLQLGIRGTLRADQRYLVRFGYGSLRLPGTSATEFRGLVGAASVEFALGRRTRLESGLLRLPLPSNFDSYYIVNELKLGLAQDWGVRSRIGVDLRVGRNRYGDVIDIAGCNQFIRKDRRRDVEGRYEFLLHDRVGFRVSASHYKRGSNCENSTYDAAELSAGFLFGWY